jgi:parallel beta-helix repeat protein
MHSSILVELKKIILLSLVFLLFSLVVVSSLPISVATHPAEIVVPDNYEKIQWAVGNASEGDTIFVKAGTYHEHVVVTKSVKLLGKDSNTTIIDGGISISEWTSNVVISRFTIQNGSCGIKLHMSSSNHVISNNTIMKNGYGISGYSNCFEVTVSDNIITSNNFSGIWLNFAHSIVSNNIISENGKGRWRELSSGIDIVGGGNNNTITGNTIENNCMGIHRIRYPAGNIIYHNNFLNNTLQVSIPDDLNDAFTWDYDAEGNFWSDYDGTDSNGDWIGDTPYVINSKNQDNYPLMSPWSPPSLPPPSPPFWIKWWFWTIVAVVIVTLAGAVYLKKRKPPITTVSPLPSEGIT